MRATKILKPHLLLKIFASEKITYKSSDKDVVTVSKKGRLKAVSPGKTIITISAGGRSWKIDVEVYAYVAPVQTYNSYNYNMGNSTRNSYSPSSKIFSSSNSSKS